MPSPHALPGRPRSAGRLARSPALSAALAARLTARDRWLLRMICEHRVLTTAQITQLAFGTTRAATARMTTLYQYRAVDRFRPLAPAGSSPLHFVLDEAGAMLVAAEDGITPADLGYRRDRAMAVALSPASPTMSGRTGSSPRWPPPPAPAAARPNWSAGGVSGAAPPPGATTPAPTGTAAAASRPPASRPPSPTSSLSTTPAPRTCPG